MKTKFESDLEEFESHILKAEKTLEIIKEDKSLLQKITPDLPKGFKPHDVIRQLIGAWMVLVPITHFSEILAIPHHMPISKLYMHVLLTVFLATMILYYSKYREVKREKFLGIPIRFLSLILITMFSTAFLMYVYVEDFSHVYQTFLFLFGFAVIGSASADVIK